MFFFVFFLKLPHLQNRKSLFPFINTTNQNTSLLNCSYFRKKASKNASFLFWGALWKPKHKLERTRQVRYVFRNIKNLLI